MKLRKYTNDVFAPLSISVLASVRGDLLCADGPRRGIEIEVASITPTELAALGDGWILWEGEWPSGVAPLVVDRETDAAISRAIHPTAAVGEELGIHREAIVCLYNALGIEPPADFARLNGIAVAAIEKARAKKEALNAKDN